MDEKFKNINKIEQENLPKENGVFEVDGKFFMYSADMNDFVEIPKEVYRTIRASLYLEERSERDNEAQNKLEAANIFLKMLGENNDLGKHINDFKTKQKYANSKQLRNDINCHRAAFYTQKNNINSFEKTNNRDSWDSDRMNVISDSSELQSFDDYKEFEDFIKKKLSSEKFGFCQVIQNRKIPKVDNKITEDTIITHSFLVGVGENDNLIAFEKHGYENEPFQIISPEKIFNKYNPLAEPDWGDGYSIEIKYTVKPYTELSNDIKNNNYNPINTEL